MTILEHFGKSKVGDLIRVNDVDLLIELDDSKKTPDFLIKERRALTEGDGEYIILTLDHIGTDLEYLLICKSFKGAFDVLLYKQPEYFKPDKRSVLQKGENDWLFDFENYPAEIYSDDITFIQKVQNGLFGDVCLVEWETESKIIDYKLLLIETGFFNDGGGWVEFYEGRQISDSDVSF